LIAEGKAKPMVIIMPDANIGQAGFGSFGIEIFKCLKEN
jgi:hypothetical protein